MKMREFLKELYHWKVIDVRSAVIPFLTEILYLNNSSKYIFCANTFLIGNECY